MNSRKFFSWFAVTMVFGSVLLVQTPAEAKKNRELLNKVLDQTLVERRNVEQSYRDNPAASRPEQALTNSQPAEGGAIAIEVGDELPTSAGSDLKETRDSSVYREKDAVSRLERELKEVDSSFRDRRQSREIRERRVRDTHETRDARGGRNK